LDFRTLKGKVIMAISEITSANSIQMDYMKLLITQLQNQNPLEPMENNEMASQLAQFSSLSQLETMNSSFSEALVNAERTYANSLIGKEVTFLAEDEFGDTEITSGNVEQVINDVDGSILLSIGPAPGSQGGDNILGLDGVISINN
jgi:flagellar basal-body rod modification protein FlgD